VRQFDKIFKNMLMYSSIIVFIWSVVVSMLAFNSIKIEKKSTDKIITNIARLSFNKDLAYRKWAASHGGVYVEPSEKTPPSPWMKHISDRDVVTTDGKKLTLMNPAYMLREMMQDYSKLYGIKGRIVGKIFLNANNKADEWEAKAIDSFDKGVKEIEELVYIDGKEYLRHMEPMMMSQPCQKCHGHLGFANGSVRGGVSVSVPTKKYKDIEATNIKHLLKTYLFIWSLGLIAIIIISGVIIKNLRRREKVEKEIEHLAHYDSLTELPNRTLFHDIFLHAINLAKRSENKVALAFIDIDGFKSVNDTKGHPVGDKLLIEITKRIKKQTRKSDTISRLGGDEFTIIFENIVDNGTLIIAFEKILKALEKEMVIDGHSIFISGSMGISIYPDDGDDIHTLIKNADTAMYRAKEAGKNRFCFYEGNMTRDALEQVEIESSLLLGLKHSELEVYYQAKISATDRSVIGMEALVRWNSPSKGMISPDKFITVAESMHIVDKIDMFVLSRVCEDMHEWVELGYEDVKVSVNLSGYDIGLVDIYERIVNIVSSHDIKPKNIEFEITETYFANFDKNQLATLKNLKNFGFTMSIDDFGTGYSSLSNLKKLPVDILKIDQSFVMSLDEDEENRKLVKMIINLAHTFSLKSIAEGVETEAHYAFLKEEGCDYIQGYLECKPMPKDKFINYLKRK